MTRSKSRRGTGARTDNSADGDWRRTLSASAIFAAVAVTLLLGWALRAGPEDAGTTLELLPSEVEDPVSEVFPTEPIEATGEPSGSAPPAATPPPATPAAPKRVARNDLERRSADDRHRLANSAGGWTLQFFYSCEPDTVRDLVRSLAGDDRLYVLAVEDCWRVCWGAFPSRERAVSFRGVPAPLARLEGDPFPQTVEKALR
jgi:hypothetical protein